jgi:hypothetical protein
LSTSYFSRASSTERSVLLKFSASMLVIKPSKKQSKHYDLLSDTLDVFRIFHVVREDELDLYHSELKKLKLIVINRFGKIPS